MPNVPRRKGSLENSARKSDNPTRPCRCRSGHLFGHKSIDHAVENNAVIEFFADQLLDTLDMIGGEVVAQGDFDRSAFEFHQHMYSLLLVFAHAETDPKTTMVAKKEDIK